MKESLEQSVEELRKRSTEEFKVTVKHCNEAVKIEAFIENQAENSLMDTIIAFGKCEQILPAVVLLNLLNLIHFKEESTLKSLGKAMELVFEGAITFSDEPVIKDKLH